MVARLIQIAEEVPNQPEVIALLEAGNVARVDERVMGCGAIVASTEGWWAEIKRMFVSPAARGNNVGRLLLQKLQAAAMERGISVLRLETGIKQPEALAL